METDIDKLTLVRKEFISVITKTTNYMIASRNVKIKNPIMLLTQIEWLGTILRWLYYIGVIR